MADIIEGSTTPAAPATTPAVETPAAPPVVEVKRDPISATMLELNRKEAKLRGDMKRLEDERKGWQSSSAERAARDAERSKLEETFRVDLQTLIEHYGWTTESAIDFMSKGGATSPEGQVRALRLQIEAGEKAREAEKTKAQQEAQAAELERAKAEGMQFVRGECKRLLVEDRFELCSKSAGIEDEVAKHIVNRWNNDQVDLSPDAALTELEAVLDTLGTSLAQSKKLQAKLSARVDGDGKPVVAQDANRQPATVPSATSRTITIKQRQQAVAPLRLARDGRAPRSELASEVAANFAAMLARK